MAKVRKTKRTQSPLTALFQNEQVRRVWQDEEWYYAAVDVVAILADSEDPRQYWEDLKAREPELVQITEEVDFYTADGTPEPAEGVTTMDALRLVQSIPTKKAERLKRWLAESGNLRLEEVENPELVFVRVRKLYEQMGYNRRWIDKRLRGITARHELTSEWRRRGAVESDEYRALTNQIMESAFGMDVETYRQYKNLPGRRNLRDHMSDLELVLTMLSETTATILHRERDSHGVDELQRDAKDAGEITAGTRKQIEDRTGHPVVYPGTIYRDRRNETAPEAALSGRPQDDATPEGGGG